MTDPFRLDLDALAASGELAVDVDAQRVYLHGRRVDLTPKEISCLKALLDGTSAAQDLVRDENVDPFTSANRVTMMTLRRKLGAAGRGPDDGTASDSEP